MSCHALCRNERHSTQGSLLDFVDLDEKYVKTTYALACLELLCYVTKGMLAVS